MDVGRGVSSLQCMKDMSFFRSLMGAVEGGEVERLSVIQTLC
jgi:hypothetical protein